MWPRTACWVVTSRRSHSHNVKRAARSTCWGAELFCNHYQIMCINVESTKIFQRSNADDYLSRFHVSWRSNVSLKCNVLTLNNWVRDVVNWRSLAKQRFSTHSDRQLTVSLPQFTVITGLLLQVTVTAGLSERPHGAIVAGWRFDAPEARKLLRQKSRLIVGFRW